nr:hypothetical protein B7L51_01100 [Pectobacterium carotovorum]
MEKSITDVQRKFLYDLRDKKIMPRNMNNRTGVSLKKKGMVNWALVGGWHITAYGLQTISE